MTRPASALVCGGCGWQAPDDEPYPFRCGGAEAGDDIDHVLARVLDLARLTFPKGTLEDDPFIAYRHLSHAYHLALAHGLTDEAYVDLVSSLDDAVRRVDGAGFVTTLFARQDALGERLGFRSPGGVWVKDETSNVSGSHKGRHLMGLMIYLKVIERVGLGRPGVPRLAIASCGNAALAAAVVASAGGFPLDVFVPVDAERSVVGRLHDLHANVVVCPREAGVPGDPTYARLWAAIAEGALPFTCQGNVNGLAIEGGETLGYEIASATAGQGVVLDRLFVQVGGGALASACVQSLGEARALGALPSEPRIHTVQTRGVFPLKRAFDLLREREPVGGSEPAGVSGRGAWYEERLRYATQHRSEFMWPWEEAPGSVAGGILDDETYDWFAVVRGMVATAGDAHVVDEGTLIEANALAVETTGIDVDPTGSAGLAGLIDAVRTGVVQPDETVCVLFTGTRR